MSKKDLLKVSLVVTLLACAGTAYGTSTISDTVSIGNSSFSPSVNVTVAATADDQKYYAIASHLNGNRLYLGSSLDPKLYYRTKAAGTTDTSFPSTGALNMSTWSSL